MKMYILITGLILMLTYPAAVIADCPLDHVKIGCNPDGTWGTDDDHKLFCNKAQLYRHSDPDDSGGATWLNWYYPLYYSFLHGDYCIGEPGFTEIWYEQEGAIINEEHMLEGTPNVDYRIIVECVDICPDFNFHATESTSGSFQIWQPGDSFNLSNFTAHHAHVKYRADLQNELYWITYRLIDDINDANQYEPSEPFTVVFGTLPLNGDIHVDGNVDMMDLAKLSNYWLSSIDPNALNALEMARAVDYFDRVDTNKDYSVDFIDFVELANNWFESID